MESLRIWPPSDAMLIQIGRFGIPYELGEKRDQGGTERPAGCGPFSCRGGLLLFSIVFCAVS